ncbi:MAG: glycosyltransferase family 2 protein [Solirubrobacteraceae bacterium]
MPRSASVIVPTLGRPGYLEVALASLAPQAEDVLVVEDGPTGPSRELAARHGARYLALGKRQGLNAARNAGLHASEGALVVFVDDDVRVAPGWLDALLAAAEQAPETEIFTGPVRASLEGPRALRSCGREGPPITAMDLGDADRDAPHAWGANMAIRRRAFERVGDFDASLSGGGDEQEWQVRHGGPIRYVARAALEHRRAGGDAQLPALMRAAYRRGREVRRFEQLEHRAPRLRSELRTLLGCLWHTLRRRCANGIVMAAHTAGRIVAARRAEPAADFLSGESGTVGGRRDVLRATTDAALDLILRLMPVDTGAIPPRRVPVLSIVRSQHRGCWQRARDELLRTSRHEVAIAERAPGELGKFENLNAMLGERGELAAWDWLLVLDDDVELPRGFLDRFLVLAERFELQLAQPAHRRRSHAAWRLTRRRAASLARQTRFVEIGPVTALHRSTWPALLPFPPLRMGWGLDAHWSALAAQHQWQIGIVDATPIAHLRAPAADAYSREHAIDEAREFLSGHAYLPASESQRTLSVHRRCA